MTITISGENKETHLEFGRFLLCRSLSDADIICGFDFLSSTSDVSRFQASFRGGQTNRNLGRTARGLTKSVFF
jgi:hypothetical protein